VPNLDNLAGKSQADVAALKPATVLSNIVNGSTFVNYFGLSMSDGQKDASKLECCNKADTLPADITKIEMFLRNDEKWFHSMVFSNAKGEKLNIGMTP
jgi:hypothetical protein